MACVVKITLTFLIPNKLSDSNTIVTYVYGALNVLAFTSHIRCSFTHPGPSSLAGHVTKSNETCRFCNSEKIDRVHHCKTCKTCILLMDHHCPFVNNCVGAANQKYFLLFCFYIAAACFYTVCLAAITAGETLAKPQSTFRIWVLMLCLFAAFVAGFFFVLVSVLLVRQVGRLLRNRTYIEELKCKTGASLTFSEAFAQVFGSDPILLCVLPIAPTLSLEHSKPPKDAPQIPSKCEEVLIVIVPLMSLIVVISLVVLAL